MVIIKFMYAILLLIVSTICVVEAESAYEVFIALLLGTACINTLEINKEGKKDE